MTPKEKAQELFDKFALGGWGKENALRCVDEIIESIPEEPSISTVERIGAIMFWFEVRKEIENL